MDERHWPGLLGTSWKGQEGDRPCGLRPLCWDHGLDHHPLSVRESAWAECLGPFKSAVEDIQMALQPLDQKYVYSPFAFML